MRSVADMSRQELEQLLGDEIAKARSEARPISRLSLIKLLQTQYTMNGHEAEEFVDTYCEEKAPGVPTYLSNEFGVPYLKVLAIFNIVVGIALLIVAAVTMSRAVNGYLIWLGLGLLFVAGAAFSWVQSIKPEKKKEMTRLTTQLPNIGVAAEAPEPVSTGSSRPNS